ncbi:MAG TPA: hypothetical protein VG982_02545 [Candidatus Paceibacterota bacterium]|nr:hypothetical protein [Candidatus Paceibacterota bacterium]
MKLFSRKHTTTGKVKKAEHPREFDARRYWSFLISAFVLVIIVELAYCSYRFVAVTKALDAPAPPALETNAAKITAMQNRLNSVEAAVSARTKTLTQNASQ